MQGTQLWSPIFAHVRSKCCNVASLFVGSSSEDESVFELGFWHVQKGICSRLRLHIHKRKKQICCVFVWWVAGLKLRVCLDWGFGKCKRELVQACICTSISQKILPGLSPGKIFWFTDVQTQAWTNYLLHLPQPQSKHALIFKAATQQTKKHNIFLFMAVQTQAWTNSLLHVPQPQSKDTFIFKATHKQRMCLHASRSRIAQTVFCTVHVQCTHSARYSACHSARPQNAVNTMGLAFCWQFTKNYRNIFFFCVFWLFLGKDVVFTAFCGRALWRAL